MDGATRAKILAGYNKARSGGEHGPKPRGRAASNAEVVDVIDEDAVAAGSRADSSAGGSSGSGSAGGGEHGSGRSAAGQHAMQGLLLRQTGFSWKKRFFTLDHGGILPGATVDSTSRS